MDSGCYSTRAATESNSHCSPNSLQAGVVGVMASARHPVHLLPKKRALAMHLVWLGEGVIVPENAQGGTVETDSRSFLHQPKAQHIEQTVQGGRWQFRVTGAKIGEATRIDSDFRGQFGHGSPG
jgi:hypothetical protein